MRRIKLMLVLAIIAAFLCACSQDRQVENQAYVLTMGVDQTDDELELTVQVPRISSGSGDEGSSSSGGSNYFLFTAAGSDFEDALEKLEWVIPRTLNLSHLKLIVFSEEIAEAEGFRKLIYDVAHTERLFSAARAVVCRDKALDFIKSLKPVIGTRLSTDILSTFDHYVDQGLVPDSNLADFYYATESVYSDPMMTYAVLTPAKQAVPASALSNSTDSLANDTSSEIEPHYIGAALFSEGIFKGVLNPSETIYANLLKGSLKTFRYSHDAQGIEIFPDKNTCFDIDMQSSPMRIRVVLHLNVSAQKDIPDLEGLKLKLQNEIRATIQAAQIAGCEPFGIGESAAKQFADLDSWISFNWQNAFENAEIEVEVNIRRTGA